MDDRDQDLEEFLKTPRAVQASAQQIRNWQSAVRSTQQAKGWTFWQVLTSPQLALGLALGLSLGVGGTALVTRSVSGPMVAENYQPSATIEQVFVKAE